MCKTAVSDARLSILLGGVQLRLMFAANSVEDLLLKQHLDSLAAGYYGKFKVRPPHHRSLVHPRHQSPCICMSTPLRRCCFLIA